MHQSASWCIPLTLHQETNVSLTEALEEALLWQGKPLLETRQEYPVCDSIAWWFARRGWIQWTKDSLSSCQGSSSESGKAILPHRFSELLHRPLEHCIRWTFPMRRWTLTGSAVEKVPALTARFHVGSHQKETLGVATPSTHSTRERVLPHGFTCAHMTIPWAIYSWSKMEMLDHFGAIQWYEYNHIHSYSHHIPTTAYIVQREVKRYMLPSLAGIFLPCADHTPIGMNWICWIKSK